jgi:hypothetical protein
VLADRVLCSALNQAERLRGPESSEFLEMLVDRLRALWLAAVYRDQHQSDARRGQPAEPVGGGKTASSRFDDME